MAAAGVAEQSAGEAETNRTTVLKAVLGHRDETLGQTQRRRQQRMATLALLAFMYQIRHTGVCEHQSH